MIKRRKINGFAVFILIYTALLCLIAGGMLLYIRSLLVDFEASQPEKAVEQYIESIQSAAREGTLEEVLPMTDEIKMLLGGDKYPDSYVDCIAESTLTYEQKPGSYGTDAADYRILADGDHVATVVLASSNQRTEMIIFSRADWALKDAYATCYDDVFKLPSSITVSVNGERIEGQTVDHETEYNVALLGDAEVVLFDIFGNSEKQSHSIRKNFTGGKFTVPSNYSVTAGGNAVPDYCMSSKLISEFEYVSLYTEMPVLNTYDVRAIPGAGEYKVDILDNLGNPVDYSFGDKLYVDSFASEPEAPADLLSEASVMDFAKNWSLFMTNDLAGGMGTLNKYLIKDSYIYKVAYRWATGVDRTFTSIHTLYNPPFADEKVSNFVKYSDDCFSVDVYLVKKMRIANGLKVDDELSRKIYFVKYDATNDGKDNPVWKVADMLGADSDNAPGGAENE